jgi:hypothetical protein
MKKAELIALSRRRARELAESGECQNYFFIEPILRREGLLGVPDNKLFREALDLACQRATGKPAYAGKFLASSS